MSKEKLKLIRNRVQCLDCGTILESFFQHDFKTCGCPNETMVDGGLAYERSGGADMSRVNTMYEYCPADSFVWGCFDPVQGAIVQKELCSLSDSHVQNIALHLRTRFAKRAGGGANEYRDARHASDLVILNKHILPELKKRNLTEVAEEIPH